MHVRRGPIIEACIVEDAHSRTTRTYSAIYYPCTSHFYFYGAVPIWSFADSTQFLDEADLLADNIAILAAPGKLVAEGSPVTLKTSLGEGFKVDVTLRESSSPGKPLHDTGHEILNVIRTLAPDSYMESFTSSTASYHLKSRDPAVVQRVLERLEHDREELGVATYDLHSTSMEDIFLKLMKEHGEGLPDESALAEKDSESIGAEDSTNASASETDGSRILKLTRGRPRSPLFQALTIFQKRCIIARRSWLTPLLTVVIAGRGILRSGIFPGQSR